LRVPTASIFSVDEPRGESGGGFEERMDSWPNCEIGNKRR